MPKGKKGFQKGQKFSEEHKRKLSLSRMGDKNPNKKPENKEKIRRAMMGNQNGFKVGDKGYWLGRKRPEMIGNKYGWKGGISFELYSVDWTETLKRAIRERDNYICQLCSQYGNTVHHKDYCKKNCSPDNLITLCVKCNPKVNFNRNYWLNYFNVK